MPIETLLMFAVAHLLAAASPGPNFFLVSGVAARHSRRAGFMAAVGITASVALWSSAAALGLNVFLDRYPPVYSIIRFAGAAYLLWLGLSMIRAALIKSAGPNPSVRGGPIGDMAAVKRGFLVNIGNPKTIAYYTSIFAVLIPPETASTALFQIMLTALFVSFGWWFTVAAVFSIVGVRQAFTRIGRAIDLIAGGAFVLFGLRLATR